MNLKYLQIAVVVGFILVLCSWFARFTWTDSWRNFLIGILSVPPQREADIPAAQVEVDALLEALITHNTDPYVSTRIVTPVRALGGELFSHCVCGNSELIFQSVTSLEVVAERYANFFDTVFRESVIRNDLIYYEIMIDLKRELLLTPVDAGDFDFLRHPAPICETEDACYEVQVFYADPSNRERSGA